MSAMLEAYVSKYYLKQSEYNSKMKPDRISWKFSRDFGEFIKSHFKSNWPSILIKDLKGAPERFTKEIGLAIVDKTIRRHMEMFVCDIEFSYDIFLHKGQTQALKYVIEYAKKIRNSSVISLFIMCSFMGNLCVYSVKHGQLELAEVPLIALAHILHGEKSDDPFKWQWINEVAVMLNRRHLCLDEEKKQDEGAIAVLITG